MMFSPRFRFLHWSLRATFIAMMAGSAILVVITALSLMWSMTAANEHLERAASAQVRLESFLQLSGRISDYGITVLETIRISEELHNKRNLSKASVEQVFVRLDERISEQIQKIKNDDEQAAFATKGLSIARMRAQFQGLDRQVQTLADDPLDNVGQTVEIAQSMMGAFGVQFAPLLAQAIEDERQDIQRARAAMTKLRMRIIGFATGLIGLTLLICGLFYFFAGRPILRRISETVEGAEELAAGNLERRLKPQGHDELTLLMTKFNRMADRLGTREKSLLGAQDELQATFDERTSDLKQSNARLEDIDNQRRRFFSDISHELRTPLTVILGESDLALKTPENLSADMLVSMKTIQARGKHLRRRVDDLLRVARSESGQLDLNFQPVDLNEVIAQAVEETYRLAEKYDVRIEFVASNNPLIVSGDPDWLRQAVSGLVVNSIRYGDNDKPLIAEVFEEGGYGVVVVTDHGNGISETEREHLFERFYRGEKSVEQTKKRGDRGFGIGLSIIKWVLDEHEGSIQVETNDGINPTQNAPDHQGTKMLMQIPLLSNKDHTAPLLENKV